MAGKREAKFRTLAGILAASERAGGPGAESLARPPGGLVNDTSAVLGRVEGNFAASRAKDTDIAGSAGGRGAGASAPPDDLASPADDGDGPVRKAALEHLLRYGEAALAKVKRGEFALGQDEGCAMEALIITDGSRPSFVLRDGQYDPNDPFIRDWSGALAAAGDTMIPIAQAVGRIQPAGGNPTNYIGSGTLVDANAGLVLTNYHVVNQAEAEYGIAMRRDGGRVVIEGELEIDFAAEAGSLATNRFRIVEAVLPPGAGAVFAGVDAVVCRIDRLPCDAGMELPAAIGPVSDAADYATGASASLALVGFPGPPAMDKGDLVDWDFVVRTLFSNRFGIKRLSPGKFKSGLGSNPADALTKRAIGHDATTFGGASGSLLTAWLDARSPAFALHFAGETVESNYALAFARTRALLEPLGVPFVGPRPANG